MKKSIAMVLISALASVFKGGQARHTSTGASGKARGRDGFLGISAPRCHTQKYKHGRTHR